MTHGDPGDRPDEARDHVVGAALDDLHVPDYPPGFLADLRARIGEEAGEKPGARAGAPAAGAQQSPPRRSFRRRRVLLAGLAAAVAVVAGVVLFGLPGASDKTGPPPVSAAAVVQMASDALATVHTLAADCTASEWGLRNWQTPDSVPVRGKHTVTRSRLLLRDDGSYRETLAPHTLEEAMRLAHEGTIVPGLVNDRAFDASTGVRRSSYVGSDTWGADFSTSAVLARADVLTGCAPGPPDFQGDGPGAGAFPLGAWSSALPAVIDGEVRSTTYEGRPAWIVTADLPLLWQMWEQGGERAWSLEGSPVDRLAVTVDRQTRLPLRTQEWYKGVLFRETRLENVRVDVELPGDAFTVPVPPGADVERADMGFRSVTLAEAAARVGYRPLVPAGVPAGCTLSRVAVARRAVSPGAPRGRDVVSMRYQRGLEDVTVTTRLVADPQRYAYADPFAYDYDAAHVLGPGSFSVAQGGYVAGPEVVKLTTGALSGARALVVTGPPEMPHLSAVKGRLLVTIAGAVTRAELIAMAGSMRAYRASGESVP